MSTQPARRYLSISEVLAELRADFPDVSVSKIRFLETEGLIAPARSPAGYRRFCGQDVHRLRIILTAQRDQYLPLKVIKERLARQDEPGGAPPADRAAARPGPAGAHATGQLPGGSLVPVIQPGPGESPRPLSRRELVDAADLSDALLTELETFGLVRRIGRQYSPESLQVAVMAKALTAFGVEARHLRAVRAAAERESTMIESLVAPILRQRGAGARELAGRTARDCTRLVLQLHRALVEGMLTEAGLQAGSLADDAPAASPEVSTDSLRRRARDVGGATA
jgi:DNA-binding transcriptional MerR regulator